MDDDEVEPGISRRSALKRIGVGAAVAWTAPVIMSVGDRAFGAAPPGSAAPCTVFPSDAACAQAFAGGNLTLSGCHGVGPDTCFQSCTPFGQPVCSRRIDCLQPGTPGFDCGPTGTNGVCNPGEFCTRTCCPEFEGKPRFECLPACPV